MLALRLSLLVGCFLGSSSAEVIPGRAFDRFISIWLENQDLDKVVADDAFADLKRFGILQTRYYAHTHPSQPNYLAAIGGDYWGLDHDEVVRIPSNVSTIVDLLEPSKISWRGYFEGIPGPGYMGEASVGLPDNQSPNGTWDYVRKHNPFVSYDSVNNDGSRLLNVLSFDDFQDDFAAGIVPQFVMMSPNMLNDGHNTSLDYATHWAREFLKPLLTDGAFSEKTLIQLTYDETEDYTQPNRIASLLLGNAVPKALWGSTDDTFYTHFSILSTMENNWGLPNLGRFDVGANVFKLVADVTKYTNSDPPNISRVNNSVSYPGPLNRNHSMKLTAFPPPNLKLEGAGGRPILKEIAQTWKSVSKSETPYDGSGAVYDGDNLPIYRAQG
ncbi:phosphoesterase family-domain-containing protein [Xylaria bambusicola]|uniref:phosphoesterase family-domain-containing protein n=1 Tax=Xylaria bambusicola TaxID=326684 RepID=UPI0020080658|nr:phosphoesterase family-domain-containing protein [Xylaria bambusicola]KAI0508301.1 phosphoesterase family-domain-containing protein [Xylaria bambusicola]